MRETDRGGGGDDADADDAGDVDDVDDACDDGGVISIMADSSCSLISR